MAKHPFANVHNQATGLGNGNELSRAHQTPAGVLPANQCFGLVHGTGRQFDNGLVNHPELLLAQTGAQVRGQAHAGLRGLLQRGREKAEAVAPLALGHIQGLVGVAKQVFHLQAVPRVQGDADAGRDKHLLGSQLKHGRQGVQQRLQRVREAGCVE